jgi:dihydroxyacid dehydratase/phosphogluconate dehydratase
MDEATLARLERSCLPTVGACAGQFTANTMAMVSEALGLSVDRGHSRRARLILSRIPQNPYRP